MDSTQDQTVKELARPFTFSLPPSLVDKIDAQYHLERKRSRSDILREIIVDGLRVRQQAPQA